ncbi:acyltransferase [Pelosinus sp. UFO1]|uniref:acyltransferase n=1 Tax=Pelosinus sp. UFO1 TaxID=484770 RepID=UPI0004D11F31|nr:acyltransferase [Pelosinus sp. UFO1]AIF53722.1 transferase hexapeptide repeat containing protein [Pelosinus sp. UFO1]
MIAETARIYSDKLGENLEIRDYAIVYQNVELGNNVLVGEHSVVGRIPTATATMVKQLPNIAPTVIEKETTLCANVIVYTNVSIGKDCLIGDNSSIFTDVQIGDKVLISRNVTVNSETTIGNHTRIMDNSHITGRTKIGSHVFISAGVLTANDSFFGKFGFSEEYRGPTIEDYVSIGVGAIILPDVTIGKGSIVAAGSVVNMDIPPGVMCAGNPAKIMRKVPKYLARG